MNGVITALEKTDESCLKIIHDIPKMEGLNLSKIVSTKQQYLWESHTQTIFDLRKRFIEEKKGLLKCINRVLKKGNLILTSELQNFENSICKYTGAKYCLGVNSGTDALIMSLWSSGISKGDEVITSPISFIASVSSIIHVGAKPVFVDVGDDLNINSDLIESGFDSGARPLPAIRGVEPPSTNRPEALIISRFP